MRFAAFALSFAAACALAGPVGAQSNDDDYTPLNSRIKRDRQFPTDLFNRWREETGEVSRTRSRAMMSQFSRCMYSRSREDSLELLQKTNYGFVDFAQIELDSGRAMRIYGFSNCLSRVANTHGTGVQLRFYPGSLRQWILQEAYFDRYADGPTWVQAGGTVDAREFPLSANDPNILGPMDFADCVVVADPYTADFFFRTTSGSEEEKRALDTLTAALGPCLPQGQQIQLSPPLLRVWLGEALWHAATQSSPAAAAVAPEEAL